jgi:hypothetical protein
MTVTGDIIMVAGEPEAGVVTGYEVLDREPAVTPRGRTVNNNQINFTHNISITYYYLGRYAQNLRKI